MKRKGRALLLLMAVIVSFGLLVIYRIPVNAQSKGGCNIAIALDVSGSMVATDENRLSIEMIEMLIDLCGEEDSVAVVAYNDYVMYQSELISMGDKNEKDRLKAEVEQLEFKGETDNGLGLKTAIDILTGDESGKESYVLFLSDGKTDLANSQSERTLEQSQEDWEEACGIAKERRIQIHTISFVNEYSEDTTEMTIASTKTDGISSVVANPLQFTKAIVQTWLAYQGQESIQLNTQDTTHELTKLEMDTSLLQSDEITFMAVDTEKLNNFEMFSADDEILLSKNDHYGVAKIKNPTEKRVYAMFSSDEQGVLLWSLMDSGELPSLPEPEPEPEPEISANAPVVTQTMEVDLQISKGQQKFDVSRLFEDEDGDIVKYEMTLPSDSQIEADLQGTMLTVTPMAYEDVSILVTVTDSIGLQAETTILFHCIPRWKEYYSLLVGCIIAGIICITGVICFFLYRFFFQSEEKKIVGFSGVICARFVDLKSKNDIPPLTFELADYPPEEISLNDLLKSVGVQEDLPDLEQICFAPYKKNQIRFFHNTKGGVFIGEEALAANKKIVIETGTVIYISFAENASEYELRYLTKGMA